MREGSLPVAMLTQVVGVRCVGVGVGVECVVWSAYVCVSGARKGSTATLA
jgi:hypothetical protein